MKPALTWPLALIAGTLLTCCETTSPKAPGDNAPGTVSFDRDIRPLLADSCVNCHNMATMPDRPSFESRELAMKPYNGGPIIVPGNPESSRLIAAVTIPDHAELAMPPVGHRVTPEQIALLKRWIAEGASWPHGRAGKVTATSIPLE